VAAGQFSLVGLAEIRLALGPRWEKVAPKVHALAEAVVAGHLRDGDIFERVGEDSYVVLFPRLKKAEADRLCGTIAKDIAVKLLGTEWDALAKVQSVRADVALDTFRSGDVGAALDTAFASGVRTTTEGARSRSEEAYVQRGAEAGRAHRVLAPVGWSEQKRPEHAPRRPWVEADSQATDAMRLSAGDPDELVPAEANRPAAPIVPAWRYWPVWDFRQQAVIRFRLHATAEGRPVHPYEGSDAGAAEAVLFENDLQALSRISADVAALSARGRRLPIICPIHYSSISLEARRSWLLHTLREVAPTLRRLLTLEVVRPDGALWTNSLYDFVAQLRGSGVELAACLPLDRAADIPLIADCAKAINTQAPRTGITEKRCIELLGDFAARAQKSKLECGVYGLGTRSLVVAASAAGFRFLAGEAIQGALETPSAATRFEPLDLYKRAV
jgi:hypothetical protein